MLFSCVCLVWLLAHVGVVALAAMAMGLALSRLHSEADSLYPVCSACLAVWSASSLYVFPAGSLCMKQQGHPGAG
jgi:hypothetical protein